MNRRRPAPAEPTSVAAGVITAITPAARRPGRVEVAVEGAVVGAVSLEAADALGLRIGRVLDEAGAARLADAVGETAAYDQALNMLAARGRSSRELRQRLVQKGVAAAHAESAVARLVAAGLLDNAEYARQVVRSRVGGRGDSRRRVAQVLSRAGVAREVVDGAVAEVFEDEAVDEAALVEAAARKRVRTLGTLDAATRRRRLYGYLARRGHDGALIRDAIDRVLAGEGADSEDASDGGYGALADAGASDDADE